METKKRIRETNAPFAFDKFCEIMQNDNETNETFVRKKFTKYKSELRANLGDETFEILSKNTFTQAVLIHIAKEGNLKNCRINLLTSKNLSYKKSSEELKPLIFLYKIIPMWYEKEIGETYLIKRHDIKEALSLPLETFLKLESYPKFRLVAPKLKKSGMKYLKDSVGQLKDFNKQQIESILADLI